MLILRPLILRDMNVLNVILFMAGFLRTLFVIIIVYYAIKLIAKYVLPLFMNQPNQHKNFQNDRQGRQEGEVTIEGKRPKEGRISRDEGEYVDFEEVD